jgi:hypothetical protein
MTFLLINRLTIGVRISVLITNQVEHTSVNKRFHLALLRRITGISSSGASPGER